MSAAIDETTKKGVGVEHQNPGKKSPSMGARMEAKMDEMFRKFEAEEKEYMDKRMSELEDIFMAKLDKLMRQRFGNSDRVEPYTPNLHQQKVPDWSDRIQAKFDNSWNQKFGDRAGSYAPEMYQTMARPQFKTMAQERQYRRRQEIDLDELEDELEKAIRNVNWANLIAVSDQVQRKVEQSPPNRNVHSNFLTEESATIDGVSNSKGFASLNKDHESDVKIVEETTDKGLPGKTELLFIDCRGQKKSESQAELKGRDGEYKKKRIRRYQGVNLYVKNLDYSVNDDGLRKLFEQYGRITSTKVMCDENGRSKGFGFVCFKNSGDATKVILEMNNKRVWSKPLYVALAQRKEDRKAQLASQYMQRLVAMRMQKPMDMISKVVCAVPEELSKFHGGKAGRNRMIGKPKFALEAPNWSKNRQVADAKVQLPWNRRRSDLPVEPGESPRYHQSRLPFARRSSSLNSSPSTAFNPWAQQSSAYWTSHQWGSTPKSRGALS